jgi:hypothetical protein
LAPKMASFGNLGFDFVPESGSARFAQANGLPWPIPRDVHSHLQNAARPSRFIINLVILRCTLALILCLAACNRGNTDKEAVRQAIIDRVSRQGINVGGMDLTVSSVEFNGNKADATVSFAPKGSPGAGMSIVYHLEQQGGKWVVLGRKDSGGAPHGGAVPGGAGANPHGGMAPPAAGGPASMPSPQDLPPTGKPK